MRESMYRLKEMLCGELDDYSVKGNLSANDLDAVHKITDTIKNIEKIENIGTGYSYSPDYSGRQMHYVRGHYSRSGGRLRDRINDMMHEDLSEQERTVLRNALNSL